MGVHVVLVANGVEPPQTRQGDVRRHLRAQQVELLSSFGKTLRPQNEALIVEPNVGWPEVDGHPSEGFRACIRAD